MRKFSLILLMSWLLVAMPFAAQAAAPTAADNTITIDEDSTYTFSTAEFGFSDADNDSFVSIQITTVETSGALKLSGIDVIDNQTISVSNLPNLTFLPALDASGNGYDSFQFTVNDGIENSTPPNTITFNVLPLNDPPVIGGTPITITNVNLPYLFTPEVTDPDLSDTQTFTITNKPDWASFNTISGTLSGTPISRDIGTYSGISIDVTDSANPSASDTLTAFEIRVNDPPVFTNHPPITINEDSPYQFTLTATDADSGMGLTFSEKSGTSLPDWLIFDPATQILSSIPNRPNNADVGTYNNLSFTVTDSDAASTSLTPFSITVINTNDLPTGNISINGSHEEDTFLIVNTDGLTGTDDDGLGPFRYLWQRNGINVGTNNSYLLGDADVGQTIRVIVSYTDRRGTDETIPLKIEGIVTGFEAGPITGINDPPVGAVTITGLPHIGETLTAENTLSDADGLGSFSYEWKIFDANGTIVDTVDTGIDNNYLILNADLNMTITVTISYTDGQGSGTNESVESIPTTLITAAPISDLDSDEDGMSDAFEATHGIDDPAGDPDGDGISNLQEFLDGTDPAPPEDFTPPDDDSFDATGLLTEVALGSTTANDGQDGVLIPQPDNIGPFPPGRHTISWTATDAAGNSTIASAAQTIDVVPMVNFAIDQINEKGTAARVTVHLNGDSPSYSYSPPEAVRIYFTVSGRASKTVDHNLNDGFIDITSGATGSIDFNLTNMGTEGETITLTMGALTNAIAGDKTSHTITITERNLPPKVTLSMSQGGSHTSTLLSAGGLVTVEATVAPSAILDWSESDNTLTDSDGDITDNTFTFNPSNLNIGTYTIAVKATDTVDSEDFTTLRHRFNVMVSAPTNHQDSNDDGIANYLDKVPASYAIALRQEHQSEHIVETQPGLTLRLGAIAFESGTNGIQVSETAIERYATTIRIPKDDHQNIGGLFDFEIHGLSQAGDSALVVIPLRKVIPANPRYRKLMPTGWQDFIVDEKNSLASAPGEKGICPPPNDSAYTSGLTSGHHCVQLRLEDGGPNDTDGTANGVITDPGGVAIEPIVNEPPPPNKVTPLPALGGGVLNASYLLLILAWLLFFNHRRYKRG